MAELPSYSKSAGEVADAVTIRLQKILDSEQCNAQVITDIQACITDLAALSYEYEQSYGG